MHRFNSHLYGGLEGLANYGLAGPRRNKLDASIMGVIGGSW